MSPIREGRNCDPAVVLSQVGARTFLAISGGRGFPILDSDGEPIGIGLPCGGGRTVEITLDFTDTYTVRRYRLVTRGKNAGMRVVEFHADDIYCDQLSEVAYNASCWR